jgi:hypothetical protein
MQNAEYFREYYKNNKEKLLARSRENYRKSVENGTRKKYNNGNKEKNAVYQLEWRKRNKEKVKLYSAKKNKERKVLGIKRNRKYSKEESEKRRWRDMERTYGIKKEDYIKMFVAQSGRCLICYRHQDDLKRKLSVDHCHVTGIVRGLLCVFCNTGLGMFKDNILFIESAKKYLIEHNNTK